MTASAGGRGRRAGEPRPRRALGAVERGRERRPGAGLLRLADRLRALSVGRRFRRLFDRARAGRAARRPGQHAVPRCAGAESRGHDAALRHRLHLHAGREPGAVRPVRGRRARLRAPGSSPAGGRHPDLDRAALSLHGSGRDHRRAATTRAGVPGAGAALAGGSPDRGRHRHRAGDSRRRHLGPGRAAGVDRVHRLDGAVDDRRPPAPPALSDGGAAARCCDSASTPWARCS